MALGRVTFLIRKFLTRLQNRFFALNIRSDNYAAIHFTNFSKPRLFSLDAHISVIRDINMGMKLNGVTMKSWNISGANRFTRSLFKEPDPVKHINYKSWSNLNPIDINKFVEQYSDYLNTFDAYVVGFPLSFTEIFESLGKPILGVNATRYELPYSGSPGAIDRLNTFLKASTARGQLTIISNNRGDRDYLKHFTGVESEYLPSVCDYAQIKWSGGSGINLIHAKSDDLSNFISAKTGCNFHQFREYLGRNYSWPQLMKVDSILVIPYNISTMQLFELAFSEVPVYVPSQELIVQLRNEFSGVLSELSFYEMSGLSVEGLTEENPNNYLSSNFVNWWVRRADFYDPWLMPNVTVFYSWDELQRLTNRGATFRSTGQSVQRNHFLISQRHKVFQEFLSKV
jgi:hypothetical protein